MKKTLRYVLISLFFLSLIGFTIPLIIYNLNQRNPDPLVIIISGNVSHEVSYTYDEIVVGEYGLVENKQFTFLNQYNTRYEVNYTGVSVWTLLSYTEILNSNATTIYFKSWDSYTTATLNLTDVEQNSENIIIAFKQGDRFLTNSSDDGGPFRAIVDLSVTEAFDPPTYCSQFWAKYVNEIIVE